LLANDQAFQQRIKACCMQQTSQFASSDQPDQVALADAVIRGQTDRLVSFYNTAAASPGFADTVDGGDGTVDSTLIVDAEILATVQAVWPIVAAAYQPPVAA
jgi:hypothetical protein